GELEQQISAEDALQQIPQSPAFADDHTEKNSTRTCTPPLTPSLSSTAIPGDPHDHYSCPYHTACCPHRRHPDPPRAATVELRYRDLLDHRRHHWAQRNLSLHPLTRPTACRLRPCAGRAAVIINGRAHPVVVPW